MSQLYSMSLSATKYLCGLIRDLASVSEGIDNLHLADNLTFSNIHIKDLIDKCLQDANAEAEKLVGALTHLTCKETAVQPTLDNSEINVIYLYSADGNPPYQQYLKISDTKLVDLGSTSISLTDYLTATEIARDYITKLEFDALKTKVTTHTDDTDIHITTTERTKWDKVIDKVDTTAFDSLKTEINTLKAEINTLKTALDKKADTNKIVKSIYIVDRSSSDAKALIQKHWNEFNDYESYKLCLETSIYTWDAEIYRLVQDFGTVLLKCYGEANVFYGKIFNGIWTWTTLANE